MKNFFKVLLLQAPVPGAHNRLVAKPSAIPPLGLGYLASVLIQNGFDVKIIDMDIEDVGPTEIKQILFNYQPKIVGISSTSLTYKNSLRVSKIIKDVLPNCIVCLGGPHVSIEYMDALQYPFIDVIVRGEGEYTFLELCNCIFNDLEISSDIKGIAYKEDKKIITSQRRPRIKNLDEIPFPSRHLMPLHLYNIPGTILTSRGCPFSCGFCAGPLVLGREYTYRSASNVINEVQTCIDLYNITSFYFVDDTMTHNLKRLMDICQGLSNIKIPRSIGKRFKWTCESRVDVVSPEILREMKKAGCTTIQFGMESGSQKLLDELGKKITLNQIENAVKWSREAGISPVLSMVFPHPSETDETIKETFNFIIKLYNLGAEKIIPALLTLFPGTRFMKERVELGLNVLTDDFEEYNLGTPILTTKKLGLEEISSYYTQLLILTQQLGGNEVGGIGIGTHKHEDLQL